jgi:hypothetical protein
VNLLQVRTWFVQESGRHDLVVDSVTYLDNGANNYINAAQRMLDRMQTTTFTEGHNWQQALVGVRHVVFPTCRAIKHVFATRVSDSSRIELLKQPLAVIKEQHFKIIAGEGETGMPQYYAPGVFRLAPELEMEIGEINVPANYLDYIGESPYLYNGILFAPACDETYAIETWAYFYSLELILDTDQTYWTTQHPDILVMASQMILEKFMRNSEGVKDWMLAIQTELANIDKDLVEEETTTINQMEG